MSEERKDRRAFGRSARRLMLAAPVLLLAAVFGLMPFSAPVSQTGQSNAEQQSGAADWKVVGQALGKEGSLQPGDVYKVSLSRNDLQVTAGSVQLKPALALSS